MWASSVSFLASSSIGRLHNVVTKKESITLLLILNGNLLSNFKRIINLNFYVWKTITPLYFKSLGCIPTQFFITGDWGKKWLQRINRYLWWPTNPSKEGTSAYNNWAALFLTPNCNGYIPQLCVLVNIRLFSRVFQSKAVIKTSESNLRLLLGFVSAMIHIEICEWIFQYQE